MSKNISDLQDIKEVVSVIRECTAPQDYLHMLQKHTDDVLIWNGTECIYHRLRVKSVDEVNRFFEDMGNKDHFKVIYADEENKTLEISYSDKKSNVVCWSSHPLVLTYFNQK